MRNLLIALSTLALAGCGSSPEPVTNTQPPALNSVTGEDDSNTVEAMQDGTLRLTFARALADANLSCDGVVKAEKMPDQQGKPNWRVTCKNGKPYSITVSPDGTANIIGRND